MRSNDSPSLLPRELARRISSRRSARLLAVALLAGACGSKPTTTSHGGIELVVDQLGVTHVYADNDSDVFYGAGYAMARDRLFQMELVRRRADGTTAELLGKGSLVDDQQARTLGFLRYGAADAARMRAENPADAALMEAWTAGVNARIAEVRSGAAPRPYGLRATELDHAPTPWTIDEVYATGKLLSFGNSNTLDADLLATAMRNLIPATAAKLPAALPGYATSILPTSMTPPPPPPPHDFSPPRQLPAGARLPDGQPWRLFARGQGSNNWAVDGAHSTSGRPWLAGDPHQPLSSPSRFWPVHMSSVQGGGTLDVIGFSFAGTPTVQLGHNAHVGWTATTNFADVMDLWDVSADGNRDNITLGDGVHATVRRNEIIRIRDDGAPYGTNTEVTLEVVEVPGYGVLLPDEILPVPRYVLAQGELLFNWTGFRPTTDASAFLALDRAADLDGFDRAADLMEVGANNLVAADRAGIDYRVHAVVPDRGDPTTHAMPWHVLSGMDRESLWLRGDLPASRMPKLRAPARGYLSSANNDPFGFTSDGFIENDPFYWGTFFDTGFRSFRIDQALTGLTSDGKKVGRAEMETLQNDVRSPMADTLVPRLTTAMAAIDTDPRLAAWRGRADLVDLATRLAAWDRRMTKDQQEPVIFTGLEWFATRRAFHDQFTAPIFDAIAERQPSFLVGYLRNVTERRFAAADDFMPDGENALLVGALADAADWLKTRFGTLERGRFTLADISGADFPNPYGHDLDGGRAPINGALDTISVAEQPFFKDGMPVQQWSPQVMSLYRMVLGFADDGTPEATVQIARGTREDPTDPHFADLQPGWLDGKFVPLPFRRADVDRSATERVMLTR